MSVLRKGLFVTLEGPEGAGKTTNREYLREHFSAQGFRVVCTREPGGTPFAEQIRELLLTPRDEPVDPLAEMLLFNAARRQHVVQVIQPAIESGALVLCDRFVDSTYAYQVSGRGFPESYANALEQMTLSLPDNPPRLPDLTLLFDLPIETGLLRAAARGRLDRFEQETRAFFDRVRAGFLERAQNDSKRFRIIDASQSFNAVRAQMLPVIMEIENLLRQAPSRPDYPQL